MKSKEQIPADIRPKTFAGVELLLDIVYAVGGLEEIEFDTLIIYMCISEATMRPLVLGDTPAEIRNLAYPPEEYRGSISRLLVAERVGLPRETVRRKSKILIDKGLVFEDPDGKLRVVPTLAHPSRQQVANQVFAAVQRYDARLRQLGLAGICPSSP